MKLRVFSDVHNEVRSYYQKRDYTPWMPKPLDTDKDTVLILAGDIALASNIPEYLNSLGKLFKAVVHVAGNHEYYKSNYFGCNAKMKEGLDDNVFHLNNSCVTIDGQKFVGTTMWTNLQGYEWEVGQLMNDYRQIRLGGHKGYRRITPKDTTEFHNEAKQFLHNNISPGCIVVTHHQPLSPPALRKGPYGNPPSATDWAYYAGLEREISEEWDVKAWVSGHIHEQVDETYFGTRLITNCVGYFGDDDEYNEESLYDL